MMDALKAKRILVVEDEYRITSDIKSTFEQRGGEEIALAPRLAKPSDNRELTRLLAEMVPVKG